MVTVPEDASKSSQNLDQWLRANSTALLNIILWSWPKALQICDSPCLVRIYAYSSQYAALDSDAQVFLASVNLNQYGTLTWLTVMVVTRRELHAAHCKGVSKVVPVSYRFDPYICNMTFIPGVGPIFPYVNSERPIQVSISALNHMDTESHAYHCYPRSHDVKVLDLCDCREWMYQRWPRGRRRRPPDCSTKR